MTMSMPLNHDAPLKLSELRDRLDADIFTWLEKKEISDGADEQEATAAAVHLFGTSEQDDDAPRVLQWTSSSQNSDGYGGFDNDAFENIEQDGGVTVKYILSSSPGGHGDDVWASCASRHVSNLFADPAKCATLLGKPQTSDSHPLLGKSLLELGAGAGIPSMTAFKCGATVVCTDQAIPHRIRCLAEAAERNHHDLDMKEKSNIWVCPYSWGDPVGAILLNDGEKFDVIVASDCIYHPQVHEVLLRSIQMTMAKHGVALLPFALHGNTDDDNVWSIVEMAQTMGFDVEQLGSTQLSPQIKTMDAKRGLVHTLRLILNKH